MKNIKPKDIIIPAVSLFVIAVVASALLALTNSITKDKIAENAAQTEIASRQVVFPDAVSFSEEKTVFYKGNEYKYVESFNDKSEVIGYVFKTATKGYGGDVTVMTGISTDGLVTGVKPLDLSETPGLGMKAQNDDFLNQFKGLKENIKVNKTEATGNEIKAITSATITSTAFTNSVNTAFEIYESITGGGK